MQVKAVTSAPLPRWRDILAILGPAPAEAEIARPWVGGGPFRLFSRSAFALAALAENLPGTLWLPGYFCNQSLALVRAGGKKLRFYPVKEDLGIDWPACNAMTAEEKPGLFVIVHYFGHPHPDLAEARDFCDRFGTKLIEDAAHVLSPTGEVGKIGDAVLWSPHKSLGVPDGAILGGPLAAEIPACSGAAPSPWLWLVKRLVQKTFPSLLPKRPRSEDYFFEDGIPAGPPAAPAMSALARRMLGSALRRLEVEAARRRTDEALLRRALGERSGVHPLFADWGEAVPWRAVFRCEKPELAALCFAELHAKGILVESWPDLPPEARAAPDIHRAALALRNSLLAFPLP